MSYYETEAIILNVFPLAEADKVITFLTPHYGILKGVAKGSRKIKSQFSGSLELMSDVYMTFSHKERELVKIDKAELKKSYFYLVSNPSLLPSFTFITETILNLIPQGIQEEKTYRMVKACLETIEENPDKITLVEIYFGIWILKLSGYLPLWKECKNCKVNLLDSKSPFFIIDFDIFCASCQKTTTQIQLEKEHLQVINLALKAHPLAFVDFLGNYSLEKAKKLRKLIDKLLQSVTKM
jgi:DNA repair protein RecO (recombination protein O)